MATFFETAILQLQRLGFFKFLLPFLITAAVIYGLLRRSQIFGDPEKNIAINATIAFAISLFVWAAPVILGVDLEKDLAYFWVQGLTVTLVVVIGLLLASMFFPPDLAKQIGDRIKAPWFWGAIIIIGIMVGVLILITSGLWVVIFPQGTGVTFSSDIFITLGAILLLAVSVVFIVQAAK